MVIAISAVMNLSSGQALSSAVLGAFSQIRPVEYVMYFAFWYWIARGRQTTFNSSFTSLNLRGSKT